LQTGRSSHSVVRVSVSGATVVAIALLLAPHVVARYGDRERSPEGANAIAAEPPGLAAQYPGDVGIENDPAVVMVEKFEETSPASVFSRWTDILNGAGMLLTNDVPAGSPGTRSLTIPWVGGGVSNGGHLYKQLAQAIDDTLYVRYYIKYPTSGQYSHNGIWVGGYNPSLAWPNPQAGVKPAGNDRFSAAAEQTHTTLQFDHYDYWMNMHQSNDGSYWGNELLNDPQVTGRTGDWMCVEQMIKLNNPVSASNGEHAIWIDGVKISHLGQGFPTGSWSGGNFNPGAGGTPFEGFRWRSDANLKINYLWLQNYSPNDPAGFSGVMKFDHVVAAKSYIGCLTAPVPPSPPTNVRIVAGLPPAPVATVTVTPATASIQRGATQQLTAVLADAGGNVLTGRTIAWSSSGMGVATVSATGLVTGVAAGSATITATSEGRSDTTAVTVTAPPPTAWPNEPSGFIVIEDTGWETGTLGNWYRIFTSADKPINVAAITGSPIGESRALQIDYPQGHVGGGGTELRYDIPTLHRGTEIYVGYYVQVNSAWQGHNSGINKMVYLHDGGSVFSAMWYEMFGSGSNPLDFYVVNQSGSGPAGFHENVNQITFTRGQWHKVEIYQKQGGANDGIVRVWVDGVLAIDRSDVDTRTTPFDNITISGIWGGIDDRKNQADFMRFDRIRISRR
jgi:hypothetical protein